MGWDEGRSSPETLGDSRAGVHSLVHIITDARDVLTLP